MWWRASRTPFAARAAVRAACGHLDPAIHDLTHAIQLAPETAAYSQSRGELHGRKQEWELALRDLDASVRLDPENAQAVGNRGWVRLSVGQWEPATADLDESLRLDPKNARVVPETPIEITNVPYVRGVRLSWSTDDAVPSYDPANETLKLPAETKFDALWAVDANGRVIAGVGFEHTEEWELGGYAVVADALHGWIRDGAIERLQTHPIARRFLTAQRIKMPAYKDHLSDWEIESISAYVRWLSAGSWRTQPLLPQ